MWLIRKSRGLMTPKRYRQRVFFRAFVLAFSFLVALIVAFCTCEASASVYTVQKGDTLYLIGKRYQKDWRTIAEINGLKVTHKDGIDYVFIQVGQEIHLEQPKEHLDPSEIAEYFEDTKAWMEEEIFRMGGIRNPLPRSSGLKEHFPISFQHPQDTVQARHVIFSMELWVHYLKEQIRYFMVDEVYHEALANITTFKFFRTEKYWEDHRHICTMMMSILHRESNGRFVRGKAGEEGPYQVLPKTYCLYKGWSLTAENLSLAAWVLRTDSLEGLRCAMDRLSKKDTLRDAFSHYNGIGEDAEAYANRVMHTYVRKRERANK